MADKVFIRYLLITVLVFNFVIVCAGGAADPIKVVTLKPDNFNVRSVLIDGKTIDLAEWSSEAAAGNDGDKRSKTMYAFVKCECAYFVNESLGHVLRSLRKEVGVQEPIPLLKQLNEKLKLAIGVLFEIADVHANLKSTEPYLLATLCRASLYVNSLAEPNNTKHVYMMKRVVLQIQSLLNHFAIQYCNAGLNHDISDTEPTLFQTALENFDTFLNTVVSWTPTPIDMDRITLKTSVLNPLGYDESSVLFKMFNKVLLTATLGPNNITVQGRLTEINNSYNLDVVSGYMYDVHRVLLKTIFLLTDHVWRDDQNFDRDWYETTITTLRSMHCSVELIENFVFALEVERYRINGPDVHERARKAARKFKEADFYGNDKSVTLREDEIVTNLNLHDFMGAVFDKELQQFWWMINLMRRLTERESKIAYNLSLDLNPGVYVSQESECKSLADIYRKIVNVEIDFADSSPSNRDDFHSVTRQQTYRLLCYLVGESNKWIGKNNQLTKILLATEIHLHREFYVEVVIDSLEFAIMKRDKVIKIINVFTNLLENYEFRNCPLVNDRKFMYAAEKNKRKTESNALKSFFGKFTNSNSNSEPEPNLTEIHNPFCFKSLVQGHDKYLSVNDYGTQVFFNWNGEAVDMRDIRKDVIENMLDIHDLVHFQRLYIKWSFRIWYKMYFLKLEKYETFFPKGYTTTMIIKKYVYYYEWKLIFYKAVNNHRTFKELQDHIISSWIELLGIVKEDDVKPYDDLFLRQLMSEGDIFINVLFNKIYFFFFWNR